MRFGKTKKLITYMELRKLIQDAIYTVFLITLKTKESALVQHLFTETDWSQ